MDLRFSALDGISHDHWWCKVIDSLIRMEVFFRHLTSLLGGKEDLILVSWPLLHASIAGRCSESCLAVHNSLFVGMLFLCIDS
jgi:hypothetical protein